MQKENRNNRVHTGDQSGKTEFPIMNLLPVGKENAISTTDLVRLTGCKSARDLQERIAYERNHGAVICSGSGRGTGVCQDDGRKGVEYSKSGKECESGFENSGRAAGHRRERRRWQK